MAGRLNASVDVAHDPIVDAFASALQLLKLEMLQRPLECEQQVSLRCTKRRAEAGIEPSVRSVVASYDDALAEMLIPPIGVAMEARTECACLFGAEPASVL